MYRWGHVGAALFVYGPVGAALSRGADPWLAAFGAAVAVACSTAPDADELLPIDHRGPTHTIWFVLGGTAVVASIAGVAGAPIGRQVTVAATAGTAAALSLGSHLLADSITPMGIRPLYPLSAWHHSFDITPAANPRANTSMLGVGLSFALLCQAIALGIP
ncbi:metal-dependent hydrolase [Natronomonas salsuginis]|jgi:inner membrane protein|uniref:Metal-dependent hydrolase n=1 Tax=Natronomonas salsuginis TaxID=2217661 RepID=A0A4U5JI21_9EURY|nr:metal-dependent hydrolase [Natronomonas salsuginis]TKR25729.1 metal-dependent hydrolase [Natronomonas salsuginis]